MIYKNYIQKRKIENIIILPLILIGKLIELILSPKNDYDIYLFFPFYEIGGAEKIHLQIASLVKDKKALIIFTRKSKDNGFQHAFKSTNLDIIDCSTYTNNNLLKLPLNIIARGYFSASINKSKAKVFNGQSNFAYKLSPWINKLNKQIELIHSFNSFSWIRLPFIEFYTTTIMISKNKINEHLNQYNKLQVPKSFINNIKYIPNSINYPNVKVKKNWEKPFKIIFVGRDGVEKRIPKIIEVAKLSKQLSLPFTFELIGKFDLSLTNGTNEYIKITNQITDPFILQQEYEEANFIILLSSTEGMPLVILEAMIQGCIPIVTKVGDLELVVNEKTGFLVINNQNSIQEQVLDILKKIILLNTDELKTLSSNSIDIIKENYNYNKFKENYLNILNS
jgi:glycosyltransferase involved in cell wall biosynthesis